MDNIDRLENQAVNAAINLQWEKAIELNKEILKSDIHNIDAILRLGFSYLQNKEIKEAKTFYEKALRIQPKNQIALENLERIEVLQEKGSTTQRLVQANLDPNRFLEVPGKTKTMSLVNIGQKNHLAELIIGQEVELKLKKRRVEIRTKSGNYIGSLPDDLSKRIIYFIEAKSEYKAYIKEAGISRVVVFIEEIKKGKKVAHFSSFPQNIQTNLDQMHTGHEEANADNEDEETEEEDEIEKLASSLVERDESEDIQFADMGHEDEEVEE